MVRFCLARDHRRAHLSFGPIVRGVQFLPIQQARDVRPSASGRAHCGQWANSAVLVAVICSRPGWARDANRPCSCLRPGFWGSALRARRAMGVAWRLPARWAAANWASQSVMRAARAACWACTPASGACRAAIRASRESPVGRRSGIISESVYRNITGSASYPATVWPVLRASHVRRHRRAPAAPGGVRRPWASCRAP